MSSWKVDIGAFSNAAMKAISICLVRKKKRVAIVKREFRLLANFNAERLFPAAQKEAKSACTGESFIESIPFMSLGFALHVEKANVPYCCRDVSEHIPSTLELQRGRRRRDKNVQESKMPQKDRTSFAPGYQFHSYSSHT